MGATLQPNQPWTLPLDRRDDDCDDSHADEYPREPEPLDRRHHDREQEQPADDLEDDTHGAGKLPFTGVVA